MNRLQVCQLVVGGVYADAEEETGISPVDDLPGSASVDAGRVGRGAGAVGGGRGAELDEVGLVLLVAGGDESVDLGRVRVGKEGRG